MQTGASTNFRCRGTQGAHQRYKQKYRGTQWKIEVQKTEKRYREVQGYIGSVRYGEKEKWRGFE